MDAALKPEDLVREIYADYAAGDEASFFRKISDAVDWMVFGPSVVPYFGKFEGKDAVRAMFKIMHENIEVVEFNLSSVTSRNSEVVAHGMRRAKALSTGTAFETPWIHSWTVEDGLVVRHWELQDTHAVAFAFNG